MALTISIVAAPRYLLNCICRRPQTVHLAVQSSQERTLLLLLFCEPCIWMLFELDSKLFCCASLCRCHFRIYYCKSESPLIVNVCSVNDYANSCIHFENATNGTALQSCRMGASTKHYHVVFCLDYKHQVIRLQVWLTCLDSTNCEQVAWY